MQKTAVHFSECTKRNSVAERRLRRRPPHCLHHVAGYPAKNEGIGLRDVPGRVTMQLFVR
jgi:hypothetical protein